MAQCLIVDDSQVVRKIIRRIMEEFFFSCEEVEDGDQALDNCKKHMPDLIMLDWNLPKVNGLEFLKALRALEHGASPKVIFCTTENSIEFIRKGMDAGANAYIVKSEFDNQAMLDIIANQLERTPRSILEGV